MFKNKISTAKPDEGIEKLRAALESADAVMIGAGSGLSAAAGYTYSGERFDKYFADFRDRYAIEDIYSGGFYPFPDMETFWAWWSRHIWINRYSPIPNDVYKRLLDLVKDKDYFVLTTNVDHCFQRAGFEKRRLFYTQGDYGLFQSSKPHGASSHKTYDNKEIVREMLLAQGFRIDENDELIIPTGKKISMRIPEQLVPYCQDDGELMTTNLRSDETFVEDEGWHKAAGRYTEFLRGHQNGKILFLEIAVGMNTPTIIKFSFWKMTSQLPNAIYACLNYEEAYAPDEIRDKSICIQGDVKAILKRL